MDNTRDFFALGRLELAIAIIVVLAIIAAVYYTTKVWTKNYFFWSINTLVVVFLVVEIKVGIHYFDVVVLG